MPSSPNASRSTPLAATPEHETSPKTCTGSCEHLPMKHGPEPSFRERMGKFARRHPAPLRNDVDRTDFDLLDRSARRGRRPDLRRRFRTFTPG